MYVLFLFVFFCFSKEENVNEFNGKTMALKPKWWKRWMHETEVFHLLFNLKEMAILLLFFFFFSCIKVKMVFSLHSNWQQHLICNSSMKSETHNYLLTQRYRRKVINSWKGAKKLLRTDWSVIFLWIVWGLTRFSWHLKF